MEERSLRGKVALVTGAGKRIGRSIALRLAEEGADVVVNYSRSWEEAEAVAEEVRQRGVRGQVARASVTSRDDVRAMMAGVEREFGRLDVLVNNAGVFEAVPIEQITEEQWDRMMDTNLKAHLFTVQEALPMLRRAAPGRVINITSLGGMLPWPAFMHYCVSKAGAMMLTRCMARGLAPDVLVNSIAPGTIQFPGELPDEDYIRRAPVKRTGTGEDIADTVAFLAQTKFITGQVIAVDGGRSLT